MYLAAWLNSPPIDSPKISIRQSQPQQPDPVGDKLTFFIRVEIFIIILQAQIIFLCVPLSRVLSFFLFFSCPIVLPSLPQGGLTLILKNNTNMKKSDNLVKNEVF